MDNDFTGTLVFAILAIIILSIELLSLYRRIINASNKLRCPDCGRTRAAQKVRDELMGIFRKGEEHGDPDNPEFRMAWYEKFRIHYRCKYCGHEWTFLESRRQ